MTNSVIHKKCTDFSLNVIQLYKDLIETKEFIMSKQLLKSSTSIGANVSESKFAQSKKDFLSKMQIALKESNETYYWLNLLHESNYIDNITFKRLNNECIQIRIILLKIINTTKENLNTSESH